MVDALLPGHPGSCGGGGGGCGGGSSSSSSSSVDVVVAETAVAEVVAEVTKPNHQCHSKKQKSDTHSHFLYLLTIFSQDEKEAIKDFWK